jgi:large subunit ribosomal protein L25
VLLNITLEGESELAIPKDVQRDPVRGFLEHVDLLVVRRGEKVRVDVPLHVVGTPVPEAIVVTEMNALEVLAEATHIPGRLDVDVSGRPIGSQILAKEVELPAGVELLTDPEHLVVNITMPRTEALPEEIAAAEEAEALAAAEAAGEGEAADGEPPAATDEQPAAE